jgi:hypothetical protein
MHIIRNGQAGLAADLIQVMNEEVEMFLMFSHADHPQW